MKIKTTILIFFALSGLLSIIALAYNNGANKRQIHEWSGLTLKVTTDKQDYLPGEVVRLNFEVVNEDGRKIVLPACSSIEDGYLRLYIAYGNGAFKEHFGSRARWQIDGCTSNAVELQPGQSYKTGTTLLWNVKPEVSHLSENAARRVAETRIMNHYALPEAGAYSIKAVLRLPGETRPTIESTPAQIILNQPTGENLEVWNKIKDNKDIAYFIQYGEFSTRKAEEREKILKTLNDITENYPGSFYTNHIRETLNKFRTNEEEAKRKIKS